jgi:molecular chaperone HtpG
MQHLTEYQGKPFRDVRRGELDLALADVRTSADERESKQLLKQVKQVLRDKVDEVRVGGRLRQSAACLVLNEHDLGYQMRELLVAAGHQTPNAAPTLELNLEHALVQKLGRETDPARFERLALLLFEQAVLAEGRPLDDPAAFVVRLNELLADLDAGAVKPSRA